MNTMKWIIFIIISAIVIFATMQEMNLLKIDDKLKENDMVDENMQNNITDYDNIKDDKINVEYYKLVSGICIIIIIILVGISFFVWNDYCVNNNLYLRRYRYLPIHGPNRKIDDSSCNEVESQERRLIENLTHQLTHSPRRRRRNLNLFPVIYEDEIIKTKELFQNDHSTRESITIPEMNIKSLQENESEIQSTCMSSKSIEGQSTSEVNVKTQDTENKKHHRWEETEI